MTTRSPRNQKTITENICPCLSARDLSHFSNDLRYLPLCGNFVIFLENVTIWLKIGVFRVLSFVMFQTIKVALSIVIGA